MRILLIEDDRWLGDVYDDYLANHDIQVHRTDDAQQAIDIMDNYKIDCLVIDMMLPRRSGIEILHEAQSYDDLAEIPKLVLSTMNPADFGEDQQWQKYGVKKYLYKPQVSPSQLLDEIKQATV